MKKIIATFFLILSLSSVAVAIVPFGLIAIPLFAVATELAYFYYDAQPQTTYKFIRGPSSPSPKSSTVDAAGDVSRPSGAVWVDMKNGFPTLEQANITTKIPFQKVRDISTKPGNENKYPLTKNNLQIENSFKPPKLTSQVGQVVASPDGNRTIDRIDVGAISNDKANTTEYFPPNAMAVRDGPDTAWGGFATSITFYFSGVSIPSVPRPATPAEFQQAAVNNPSPAYTEPLAPVYASEIDKMVRDPDYVPSFTDDTTGQPFIPSPDALTKSQINTANAEVAKTEANAANAAALQLAADTAAAGSATATALATAAAAAANAAAIAAAGNTGSAALAVAAAAAKAASDATAAAAIASGNAAAIAAAAAAKAAADAAALALQQAKDDQLKLEQKDQEDALIPPALPNDNVYPGASDADKPALKSIAALLGTFVSGSPLVAMVRSFTIRTSGASGIMYLGTVYGTPLTIDFTQWESTLRACGGTFLIIMHGFAILVVMKGW